MPQTLYRFGLSLSLEKEASLWKRIGELTVEVEDHSQHALDSAVQFFHRAVCSRDPAEGDLHLAVQFVYHAAAIQCCHDQLDWKILVWKSISRDRFCYLEDLEYYRGVVALFMVLSTDRSTRGRISRAGKNGVEQLCVLDKI